MSFASVSDSDFAPEVYARAISLFGELRLPPCSLRLRTSNTTKCFDVYDVMRNRWVALTPEEWVRQHFVAFMIEQLGFPPSRIANEVTLRLNKTVRRADTVVYDDLVRPLAVVEYKAPSIRLTTEILSQAQRYNLVFNARLLMVTNGLDVYSIINNELRREVITYSRLKEYLKTLKQGD